MALIGIGVSIGALGLLEKNLNSGANGMAQGVGTTVLFPFILAGSIGVYYFPISIAVELLEDSRKSKGFKFQTK